MFSYFKKAGVVNPSKGILQSEGLIPAQLSLTNSRSQNAIKRLGKKYPSLWVGVTGLGVGLLVLGVKELANKSNGNDEIAFRKQQLAKDPYVLKGDEAHDFPWRNENLNEWLYRPVVISGRPRHAQAMLVPRIVNGYHGYDYIVPLITKENEDNTEEYGILLNKGWIPHEFRHIGTRARIENVFSQTFLAYVSLNTELDYKQEFFKEGNAPKEGRNKWGHVYLPDMAEATGFKNADQMKIALLEVVDPEATKLDERSPVHYSNDLAETKDYPYPKTFAGALQLKKMPWESAALQGEYFTLGTAATLFGLALKFVK